MEDSTNRFSDRVENYVRYRPSYPDELIDYLIEAGRLDERANIADVGSGTGIFSKLLLNKQLAVTAVEPNREMRKAAEAMLADYPRFTSVAGTGEATTLDNSSADFVVVAQAFHWFDWPTALAEFRRILKTGGQLALVWNRRNLDDPFQQAYDSMLRDYAPEYNRVNHMNIEDEDMAAIFDTGSYRQQIFRYAQLFDLDAFLGRMQSSSYAPAQGTPELSKLIDAATDLQN